MKTRKNWLVAILREHPALLVTGIYVLASTIGMLYSWIYLRQFGVNVFNYAQIGDFLLASLKEPLTWLIVLISIMLIWADNRLSRLVESNSSWRILGWYGSARYRTLNYAVALLLIIVLMFSYADFKKREVLKGGGRTVHVQLVDSGSDRPATLLGTTGQFVILYIPDRGMVDIHPHESIRKISFKLDKDRD